jgi:hypothetical protein
MTNGGNFQKGCFGAVNNPVFTAVNAPPLAIGAFKDNAVMGLRVFL